MVKKSPYYKATSNDVNYLNKGKNAGCDPEMGGSFDQRND